MKNFFFILTFIFLQILGLSSVICAQSVVQTNDEEAAQMFAPGIVSTGDVYGTTFSPDGKTVYFCKSDEVRKNIQIMVSRLENGRWSEPVETEFSKLHHYNAQPFITLDGKHLYYPAMNPVGGAETKQMDIFVVQKSGNGWTKPQNIGAPINTEMNEYFPTISRQNTLYYASDRGLGGGDIWRAKIKNGKIVEREMLAEIDTTKAESNPLIAPDESFLIFLSDREGGFGAWDLWVSFNENGKWSAPVNLGKQVNTEMREFSPALSRDGKYLYFTRTMFENGRRTKPENIFFIELKKLPSFKQRK